MNLRSIPLLVLFAIIVSSGLQVSSFAQSGVSETDVPAAAKLPLVVSTDESIYTSGNDIKITVEINRLDTQSYGITILVKDPKGGIVDVKQINTAVLGENVVTIKPGVTWKVSGEHTIEVKYGAQEREATFDFTASGTPRTDPGSPVAPTEPAEPTAPEPSQCISSQDLIGGECVPKCGSDEERVGTDCVMMQVEMTCESGYVMRDDQCISICADGSQFVNGKCEAICGSGTEWVDGKCEAVSSGGGCLIATAAYGSELSSQVQILREIRDGTLMSTASGTSFMTSFNTVYYSFSPTIADLERQSPEFKSLVQTVLTPMLHTLSIMSLADEGSESSVLGLGISVIALNLGMYIAAPAAVAFTARKYIKSRH